MRDHFHRETIGTAAEDFKEDWEVQIQGNENDPDCVIILPKTEEKKEE